MTTAIMHIPVADPTCTLGAAATNGVAVPCTGNPHGSATPADQAAHHNEASATYAQPTLLDGSFHRGLLKPRTRGGCGASTHGAGDAGAASCLPTTGSSTTDDIRGTRCHSSWFANHGTLDLLATYRYARLAPEPGPLPYHWNMAGENLRRGTGLRAPPGGITMASIELLRPELHGSRFKTGSISLEFLSDLSALGQLIKDVAKWHFLEENPDRRRLPRGFNDRADLKLTKIDVGSSILVIELSTSEHPTQDDSPMYQKLFKAAVKDIVSTIDAAGQNGRASPNGHIPAHYLAHFNGIGRNLRDDESMDLHIPRSQISARLDQTKRRELLERSRVRVRTEETTLRGSVPEVDQDRMSFEFQLL